MQALDHVVIGGGIVGLGIAAALRPFGDVAVLEKHQLLIHETSSRNSGVVHAGIYYPKESLKTRLSMEGNANIWRWHQQHPGKVQAKRVGKWIGTSEDAPSEEAVLGSLINNMNDRGIAHEMISQSEQRKLEPLVRMRTVVNSRDTGIIDVASLRDAYAELIENADGNFRGFISPCAEVTRIDIDTCRKALSVTVRQTDRKNETFTLGATKSVVCAVGLHGNELWERIFVNQTSPLTQPPSHLLHFCKGRYTTYSSNVAPVSRLLYPCPLPQLVGLGVHSTIDMSGAVRFGPDAVYTDSLNDYSLADARPAATGAVRRTPDAELAALVDSQYEAVRRYLPSVEKSKMIPDFVGIRPKLAGPGEPFRDFLFEEVVGVESGKTENGSQVGIPVMKAVTGGFCGPSPAPRLLMVTGIESPGLTASTAIGDWIAKSLVSDEKLLNAHLPPWKHK